MPMLDLLCRGIAHTYNLDIKGQIHPGKRMVGIQRDLLTLNRNDRHNRRLPIWTGLKAIAYAQFVHWQHGAGHLLHLLRVVLPVGFCCGNNHALLRTRRRADKLLFQTLDDLSGTLKVAQGIAADRTVEQSALGIAKGVVKGNDVTCHFQKRPMPPAHARAAANQAPSLV